MAQGDVDALGVGAGGRDIAAHVDLRMDSVDRCEVRSRGAKPETWDFFNTPGSFVRQVPSEY